MTLRVICEKCSFTLYEGKELKPPYEIIEEYEGKCPACGNKLSYIPKNVKIVSFDANEFLVEERKFERFL